MNTPNADLVINSIANAIHSNIGTIQQGNIGIAGGNAGIALFLAYYSEVYNDESALEDSLQLISTSLDEINAGLNNPLYSSGITGLAWMMSFLKNSDILEYDDADSLSAIEQYIASKLDESLRNFEYDYLHGGLGYVMYFIEKYKAGIDQDLVRRIADAYKQNSIVIDENKVAWKSTYMRENDDVEINFGLAHGVPSILIILAKLYSLANSDSKIILKELISRGANYLLAQKTLFSENSSCFSYTSIRSEYSRLAWCYGDLGVAYSLYRVGEVLDDSQLKHEGLAILLASTNRRDLASNDIMDAGVCHGTAGVMQIYGNLYKETGLIEFKTASEYWFRQTLVMGNNPDFIGGFKFWYYNDNIKGMTWKSDLGLLVGIAGIGLSLLSHVDDYKFCWDKSLLLRL